MNKNKNLPKQTKKVNGVDFGKYLYNIIGNRFFLLIILNFLVGITDGFGLAMFIPLLSIATGSDIGNESLGSLDFIPNSFESMGISLTLVNVLLIMVFFFSLKAVISYLKQIYFIKIRLFTNRKIRFELIDGFKDLSYRGYTEMDPGKIQFGMLGETNRLVTAMTHYINIIQNVIILITYMGLAFLANWQFAILVGVGGLTSNLIFKVINNLTVNKASKISEVGNRFNRFLIQAIHNFKYLKATNSFSTYDKNLKTAINDNEYLSYKIGKYASIADSLREPFTIIIIAIVILINLYVMEGDFGGILISLLLFYRALTSLIIVQSAWNNFLSNAPALQSIVNLLQEFKVKGEPKQIAHEFHPLGDISLEKIGLNYNDTPILKNINLHIPKNTTVAFVGESGAGKTTLANVIGGLVDPNEGTILLNQSVLLPTQLNSFRNNIGYISQEPVIFNDSIYNNVTFWADKTQENLAHFNDCLKMVHLEKFVNQLNQKENAPLGNNGILISGGQKQRISIARELYKKVDLLIMDEATSALDSETEQIIKENINSLHGHCTMIIIAHRLSTIKHADQIYLMKNGEIVKSGNYNQLLDNSEQFRKMVDLQEV